MGCVNTTLSAPRKQDCGYGGESRAIKRMSGHYNHQRPLPDTKPYHRISTSRTTESGGGREGGRGERAVAEGEKHEVGNVSKRFVEKKIGKDVYVGAWPKWLVDNMPAYVLVVLVPKSAVL